MSDNLLQHIQQMQFTDRSAAEALLVDFISDVFKLDVRSVELRPTAVSLNSFNGYVYLADGRNLFFKTHTESDNVIGEYYRAGVLAEAGYPVIQPLYSSTQAGKHLLIYEKITSPSVFDVAWSIETDPVAGQAQLNSLTQAQNQADDELWRIYQDTLNHQSAESAAQAPIHQLFYHRIVGGRLERFYGLPGDAHNTLMNIQLPGGHIPMQAIYETQWDINGQVYDDSLSDLIEAAKGLLHPTQAGPSIIGHGDAHNGNVFLVEEANRQSLLYFDPAFAGQHHPLLDLTKPLFHNVFAMWMYYPAVKQAALSIELERTQKRWKIRHDYSLPPHRHMFLQSKTERVLIPIVRRLKNNNALRKDWRNYIKAALMCCPLLTMNLADSTRFPPEITLLGFAMAIEMGSESHGTRSLIDQVLDQVEQAVV